MPIVPGSEFKAVLNSADASAGLNVPIFLSGTSTARALGPTERLVVTSVQMAAAGTGDTHLFFGATSTPGTGSTIARATLPANGTLQHNLTPGAFGPSGVPLRFTAAAGAANVVVTGYIQNK